jgi:hypothetical protein
MQKAGQNVDREQTVREVWSQHKELFHLSDLSGSKGNLADERARAIVKAVYVQGSN